MKPIETLSRDDDRRGTTSMDDVVQLFVLVECDRPTAASSRHLLRGVTEVVIGRADGDQRTARRVKATLELGIPDQRMSQPHARLLYRDGRWIAEDAGSKNGVLVDGERRTRTTLASGTVLELGHTLLLIREGACPPETALDLEANDLPAYGRLRTFVPALARGLDDLEVIARTSATVLIQGESGTGKELVAHAIHTGRTGAFVAVNCGALPATLVESELYGHKKGAFSGADQDRLGLVRSADKGTLFLDEIADLPLASQAALLRVLQEREVTPVGGTLPVPVDLRVVAATHHDLSDRVARGDFRHDLYARTAAYTAVIPPLRDRPEDLGLLLAALLGDARITTNAARALLAYDWPLNVRELESALTIAGALARGGPVRLEHLPAALRSEEQPLDDADRQQRDELIALLRDHAGNVSKIARATGKARAQIHRWMRRFRLDPDAYR